MMPTYGEVPRPRPVVVGGRSLKFKIGPSVKPFDHEVTVIGAVTGQVFSRLLITDEDAVELMNKLYTINNQVRDDQDGTQV